ncbi:ACP S-malonyltransferase [Streptomyces sp. NPDC050658]|uniref:ACP S-malonyltransferase n=1 Tax=unclassified Streptomyces TaxID=2593676 RepID=UPI00343AE8DA
MAKFLLINPAARGLTAEADEILGYSLVERCRATEDPFSEYSRVAFLVSCLALARWAEDELGAEPEACVGPSFGGTPAAVHAGSLAFADAVRLTAGWSHRLDRYFAEQYGDVVTQSFARVPSQALDEVLAELTAEGEWYDIACRVDEDFHMLSLRERRVDWLRHRLRAIGGLALYTMRPPMHSRAFGELRDDIERTLFDGLEFADPRLPVVCDHDGKPLHTGDEIRTMLLDGIVRAVQWPTALDTLRGRGIGTLWVAGPDSLWGRVRVATRNFDVVQLTPEKALAPRRRKTAA